METSPAIWAGFIGFVFLLLAVDLGVFHKKSHTVSFKESIIWSAVWIALAMVFSLVILQWRGEADFMLFITGYVIEKSLSVDNLFVFLLIFSYFKTPNQYQHKILFYGILGALIMRALFIGAGIAIIQQFSWVIYIFGGFLIFTGLKMLKPNEEEADLENNFVLKLTKKIIPSTEKMDSNHFFTKVNGKWLATPLFITLIFVEFSDVVFAIDSIPAIIGITTDPFLVFTSNVFAILGLRSLYFALKGFSDMFHYLKYGLAVILVFIGTKMCLSHFYHVPVWVTMMVIFGVLIISMVVSIAKKKQL
ncbi:MAG: TerC family protein [Proteobacteria bacterium]|jgi:tellurite resistance protein TerC|nr:TerC family protein [Pseudomonadota bacterium]